jgi:hypothetical protein
LPKRTYPKVQNDFKKLLECKRSFGDNTIKSITIWTIIFFFIYTFWYEVYEEPNLEKKFGEEYIEYRRNVARWVPKIKPYKPKIEFKK